MMRTNEHRVRRVIRSIIVAEAGEALITKHMNIKLREEILAPYIDDDGTGSDYQSFTDMSLSVLQRLIDLGFVDMEPWNDCGGVHDLFLPFLKRNPLFNAHGYVIASSRPDSRVTVEGVDRRAHATPAEIIDFWKTFASADELEMHTDYLRCWYD